ncbi:hypothetical protein CA13_04970 [Planctomycetes bacterium CA13]|uniref:Uncharacterized protein n=1 Tax=Novipirellula herctigrandis TaxID=2527986 RepID=A0A5C5YW72_9BACT|nr:hypothetical protein CA13_04970 [Planctomycetes bacterium CA13]
MTRCCFIAAIVLLAINTTNAVAETSSEKSSAEQTPAHAQITDTSDNRIPQPSNTALTAYVWDFSRSIDNNYDDWPDNWQRKVGSRYPQYVKIGISPHDESVEQKGRHFDSEVIRYWPNLRQHFDSLPPLPPSFADLVSDRYLEVELDGGLAMVQSDKVKTSRVYQYRLSARVMTRNLVHDSARVEFVFIDEDGQQVEVHSTEPVSGATNWKELVINNVRAPNHATHMFVRLIVEGAEDGLEDIRGTVGFDDIRIEPFPQLQLITDEPLGVYEYGHGVVATAIVLGLPTGASKVHFQLFDVNGKKLASERADIATSIRERTITIDSIQMQSATDKESKQLLDMRFNWTLPRMRPGFYRVTAFLEGKHISSLSTETNVAVIEPLVDTRVPGCFGWTLPQGDKVPHGLGASGVITATENDSAAPSNDYIASRDLVNWLLQIGVDWVKFPCWVAPDDDHAASRIVDICTRLQDSEIQTVGMLDVPREDQIPLYDLRSRRDTVASEFFRDIRVWHPLLEPVMTRLTLKVRKWQLGADDDYSFLGRSRLRESISSISTGLQGYGQPLEIAICWPWTEPVLPKSETSWQAVCRSGTPELTSKEIDSYLELSRDTNYAGGPETWIVLNPAAKSHYERDSRILDMVLRMATVRKHRVQAAFVSNPHDPENGLLTSDSRPTMMLLPWRTTAQLIGSLRQVGSLRLRSKANNIVFAGQDRAVLMVWSETPCEEKIYLGDDVEAINVWGRTEDLEVETIENRHVQSIKIGRLPIFLVNVDPENLAFRMSVEVEQTQIDSMLGQAQPLDVSFANPTRDGLAGSLEIRAPEAWSFDEPSIEWELLGGHDTKTQFEVVLGNSAKVGDYELALNFEQQTVPPKRFTVYREITVGPVGLELRAATRILEGGQLQVEVEMLNHSRLPQSYDCILFPHSGRKYQRRFIQIEPGEVSRRDFYLPDAADLLGTTLLLRASEQDGHRILNYEIPVQR